MKSSTNIDQIDDNEDGVSINIVEKEKPERKTKKKKTKKRDNQDLINNLPENQIAVEFILNDFKDLTVLKTYKNMRSLTLINQNIISLSVN